MHPLSLFLEHLANIYGNEQICSAPPFFLLGGGVTGIVNRFYETEQHTSRHTRLLCLNSPKT